MSGRLEAFLISCSISSIVCEWLPHPSQSQTTLKMLLYECEWRNEHKHLPPLSNWPCTQQKRERTRKNHLTHILKADALPAIAGGAAKTQGSAPAERCRAVTDTELEGHPLHTLVYPAQRNCFMSHDFLPSAERTGVALAGSVILLQGGSPS